MASVNKAIILGRSGADVEIRYTQSGAAVAQLAIATNESWFDKTTQQRQERTTWHTIKVWGKQAEYVAKYAGRGSTIYVEGRLGKNAWTDKQGNKRESTEITAEEVKVLDGFKTHSGEQGTPPNQAQAENSDPYETHVNSVTVKAGNRSTSSAVSPRGPISGQHAGDLFDPNEIPF